MRVAEAISFCLVLAGSAFFLAGSVGVLRFPDVYTRLHALTKADNLGLGLIVAALAIRAGSVAVAAKLLLTWLLVLVASATAGFIVSKAARVSGVEPWRRSR